MERTPTVEELMQENDSLELERQRLEARLKETEIERDRYLARLQEFGVNV